MPSGKLKPAAIMAIAASIGLAVCWMARRADLNMRLLKAVGRHDSAAARHLLSEGASANATLPGIFWNMDPSFRRWPIGYREKPQSVLLVAANENDTALVRLLLSDGANAACPDENSDTPLTCAVLYGNTAMTRTLLEHRAKLENMGPQKDAVSLVNGGLEICSRNPHSRFFAGHDHAGTIALLLGKGLNIDTRGDRGRTMLTEAARTGDVEAVKVLLAHHADVTIADDSGQTPASYARQFGHQEIESLLASAKELRKPGRRP
jgi:ankyrin repeat protein